MSVFESNPRHPFLAGLGERVRILRARRGMTRRAVAQAAQVSERHLANLEAGSGNASILIFAPGRPSAELLGGGVAGGCDHLFSGMATDK